MSAAEKRVALEVSDLACGYGGRAVLEHVSFSVPRGRAVMLLGPNGVGKTTLFKTVLGFLPRLAGSVLVEGEEVRGWTRKRYARSVAYVPQAHDAAFGFTVREMVLMGRTPALEGFSSPTPDDEAAACAAIDRLGFERACRPRLHDAFRRRVADGAGSAGVGAGAADPHHGRAVREP